MAQRVTAGASPRGGRVAEAARGLARRGLSAVAAAGVRAWSRARRPRPRVLRVPGLARDTTVRFDEDGVPHIHAAGEADAFRALGVCHALDRFFQMDVTRRLLKGRLSELVGERSLGARALPPLSKGTTVDADRLMRTLDLERAARRILDDATPDERALLDAYCAGVNALAIGHGRRPSIEHVILGLKAEPWTPLDCCLMAKGMAIGLSFKWRSAPVFAAIAAALVELPEHLAAMLPRPPGVGTPTIARRRAPTQGLDRALDALGWEAAGGGSNSFLVGGARSASGSPILANDPHLDLSLPPVWYLASVRGGPYAAVGATLAGVPGVVIGRTPTVAWGLTNAMLDDGDLWTEEVDGTGTRYRVDGDWRDLEVETQEIRRRGLSPVLYRLRRTHRGPLLTDALPGATGAPLSLRLVLHESTGEMRAFLGLGRARTAEDVERAGRDYAAPAQNLIWATTTGEAGYRFFGRVPLRPPTDTPILPRDGTTSASDWTGWVPDGDLPSFRVPPDGSVVTANDPHAGSEESHYFSCLYEPVYRAERIRALLKGRRGLTPEDLARIQLDVHSLGAEAFRRHVLLPCADAIRATRPPATPMLDRLLATTGSEAIDATGPALLHLTYYHLARRVFGLHLDVDLVHRWMACVNLMDAPLMAAFTDPDSPWSRPAVRPTLLGEAMEAAAKDLASRGHGIDVKWGEVHRLAMRHPLSAVPILGDAFTQGPYPMGGGPYTPLSGQYLHDRPAAMIVGASYRHVVDMADPEGSARMIMYGGQSGHVGSPHYADLTPRWRAGRFLPMRLERFPERGRDLLLRG